jgi:hypothetical protein
MKDVEAIVYQKIAMKLVEDIVELSKQKFSSNVIEKVIL